VGLARCKAEDLLGGDAEHNAQSLEDVLLDREFGAHRDALLLGAGLMLELTGRAAQLEEGIAIADKAISDGSAASFLKQLRAYSESLA
jgi:anthranilate phosphoribosyltransferase